MNHTVMVTGGTGFIGTHLVSRLLVKGFIPVVVDDLSHSHQPKSTSLKFYQSAIEDPSLETVFKTHRFQAVFHLAALSKVGGEEKQMLKSNVIGTYNLAQLAAKHQVPHVVFTSSAAVYGDVTTMPLTESTPTRPISLYGLTKLTGELYLKHFPFHSHIFRLANVYGPGQDSTAEGGVVAIFIKSLLGSQPITIFGDGQQTRDFIYVDDVVSGLIASLDYSHSATMHLSTNQSTSVNQLLEATKAILASKATVNFLPSRQEEIAHSRLDNNLAISTLSWQPKFSLSQGLAETVKYFQRP